ncbi:MAG: class I SAM-dependent methyltransferase [Spirochaeta sp.]|jgi:SAM-dependent methyltransferase|nr:class I SAM-dependent methyltransferase [Spirochaeta sp.]
MHTTYLEAKRTIDDRSIHPRLWERFLSEVGGAPDEPLRIVELGAGSGTMVERLREWNAFPRLTADGTRGLHYDAWEYNPETAAHLQRRIADAPEITSGRVFDGDIAASDTVGSYDAVIAHAVLDLFPSAELPRILDRFLRPGGILYGTIIFDGVTILEPVVEPELDTAILNAYHRTMTGGFARRHIPALIAAGYTVLDVAASDWIVTPHPGAPDTEHEVLISTVLDMLESSVSELILREPTCGVTREQLTRWLSVRREQVRAGTLLFAAHQFDLVAQR